MKFRNWLILTIAIAAAGAQAQPTTIHVDPIKGNDANTGLDSSSPFRTFKAAAAKLKPGMTLWIAPSKEPYRQPLVIAVSGEPGRPIIIEGNGLAIDLGTDVSDGPWKQDGNEWILEKALDHGKDRLGLEQAAGLFIDSTPIYTQHPKLAGPLKPGQMRFDDNARARVVFPEGKRPGNCRVIRPMNPMGASGVSVQGSHVTVRNITCRFAGNDGFNLHGRLKGLRLENVKAFFNGDEGISAHDQCEMEVIGAEIAHNGSTAGGVADVNESVTIYRNCIIHHNRAAFHFDSAGRHEVHDSIVFANARDLPPRPQPNVAFTNVIALPRGPAPDPAKYPPALRPLIERAAANWEK